MELVGSQVAFKGSNGLYLAKCNVCRFGLIDLPFAVTHNTTITSNALWKPYLLPNGKYAFSADTGSYLRLMYSDPTTHFPNYVSAIAGYFNEVQAQWTVTYLPVNPKLVAGLVTLTADNGGFLRLCKGCGGSVPDMPNIQKVSDGSQAWNMSVFGNKVAFMGNNGLFLSRCNKCWPGWNIPESIFVYS